MKFSQFFQNLPRAKISDGNSNISFHYFQEYPWISVFNYEFRFLKLLQESKGTHNFQVKKWQETFKTERNIERRSFSIERKCTTSEKSIASWAQNSLLSASATNFSERTKALINYYPWSISFLKGCLLEIIVFILKCAASAATAKRGKKMWARTTQSEYSIQKRILLVPGSPYWPECTVKQKNTNVWKNFLPDCWFK